jgi:hypothetical protein
LPSPGHRASRGERAAGRRKPARGRADPRDLLADKGFNGRAFAASHAACGIVVLVPPGKKQRARCLAAGRNGTGPDGAVPGRRSSRWPCSARRHQDRLHRGRQVREPDAAMVSRELSALRSAIVWRLELGWIGLDPTSGLRLPQPGPGAECEEHRIGWILPSGSLAHGHTETVIRPVQPEVLVPSTIQWSPARSGRGTIARLVEMAPTTRSGGIEQLPAKGKRTGKGEAQPR